MSFLKRNLFKIIILILVLTIVGINNEKHYFYKDNLKYNYLTNTDYFKITKDDYLMQIIIPKINLKRKIYNIDSSKNNVSKNIELLKESTLMDSEKYHIYLAAHSGNSFISYFRKLNKLKIQDEVKIFYKNDLYIYEIFNIKEEEKKSYIVPNNVEDKMLTLITCIGKEKRLIIDLREIAKESNNIKNYS